MVRATSWPIRKPYLAWVCALSGTALAGPTTNLSLADMSLEELSNVEITSASKRPEPLSDAAASVFVITADDIRRSGASNLPDALRLAPNLNVAQISNSGYSISARGFSGTSSNKLLVLIDGRSVYTPLFAGVFWDVQDVLLQDVERIEVISGPGGTLWGVNAVNGVINVITRSAVDTTGSLLVGNTGNRGSNVSARYGVDLDGDGSYRIYSRHFNLNHTQLANGRDVDDAGQMSQVGFRADWERARSQVTMEGSLYRGDHGQPLPGSIVISGRPFTLRNIETKGGHLLARWTRKLDDGSEFNVQAYVDHTERVVPPTFSEKLDITDVQFQYALPREEKQAWVLGGQYRLGQDRVDNTSVNFAFLPADVNQTWTSLFAQNDITLSPSLRLTLGARLESNDYTGVEWLPNARLAWKPAADHLLWTALSRTVRAPSRLDRDPYIPSLVANPPYLLAGGPGVDAEVARVFEIGYRGQPTPQSSVSLSWYRSLYDNLHTQELSATRNYLIFSGRMRAAINGLEAWGSYQPKSDWRLSAGFSGLYQRFALAADSTDRAGLAAARGKDPAQTWLLRSSWDGPHGHEFDATLRHVSMLNNPYVPGYLAFDLRWGWHVRTNLELSITGRNLLGTSHGEYTSVTTRSEIGPGVSLQAVMWF